MNVEDGLTQFQCNTLIDRLSTEMNQIMYCYNINEMDNSFEYAKVYVDNEDPLPTEKQILFSESHFNKVVTFLEGMGEITVHDLQQQYNNIFKEDVNINPIIRYLQYVGKIVVNGENVMLVEDNKDISEEIYNCIDEEDRTSIEDIYDSCNYSNDLIDQVLFDLMKEGKIFQPLSGEYMRM